MLSKLKKKIKTYLKKPCIWEPVDAGEFGIFRLTCKRVVWYNGFPEYCPECGGKVLLPAANPSSEHDHTNNGPT